MRPHSLTRLGGYHSAGGGHSVAERQTAAPSRTLLQQIMDWEFYGPCGPK